MLILEEHGYHLSDRRHMSDMIPFILQHKKEIVKKEMNDKTISVTFDGTSIDIYPPSNSKLGEVFVTVVRFAYEWSIQQRLIRMQLLVKTMTGDEIARTVISTLSTEYGIGSEQVLGIMHDCASTNVALRTIKSYILKCFKNRVFFAHFESCWRDIPGSLC